MKTYPKNLTTAVLRSANQMRLPEFKNMHGKPAHSAPDGSDWSPAQWLEALVGEVGELAEVRLAYEAGRISPTQAAEESGKEAADVLTYLDLYAQRCLDRLEDYAGGEEYRTQGCPFDDSHAQRFMQLIATLGKYANAHKKLMRGDITLLQFEGVKGPVLRKAFENLASLATQADLAVPDPLDKVVEPHPAGVNLGEATINKFNEVSERVQARVFIHYVPPGCMADGHELTYIREEAP